MHVAGITHAFVSELVWSYDITSWWQALLMQTHGYFKLCGISARLAMSVYGLVYAKRFPSTVISVV